MLKSRSRTIPELPRGPVAAGLLLALLLLPAVRTAAQADDPAALEAQAEQAYAEDDMAAAAAFYRRAADALTDPAEKVRVLMTLALTHYQAAQDSESLAAVAEALVLKADLKFRADVYPEGFRAIFLRAQQKALAERQRQSNERVNQGLAAFRERRYDEARRLFQEALTFRGDHALAVYNLALTDLSQRRNEDALAGFQKVLSLGDQLPGEVTPQMRCLALTNLGYLHNLEQRYDESERLLLQAVEVDPRVTSAWTNLGVTRRALGNKEGAAEAFKKAYELDPDEPRLMSDLALVHIDREEWLEAVALLKKATDRDGNDPSQWLNFGMAQKGMGNVEGALASFARAIALDPDNARGAAAAASAKLAEHYLAAGQPDAALRESERLVGLAPAQPEGWVYQGLARKAKGDLEGARTSLEEARRLAPGDAEIHNNLGSVYFELRRVADAEASFREALTLDPAFHEAQENLRAVTTGPSPPAAAPPPSRTARTTPPPPPPKKTRKKKPTTAKPAPTRVGKLGLRFSSIDYAALGLQGVLIDAVTPGSLAARAGIEARDVLLRVDGQEITKGDDVKRFVDAAAQAGKQQVTIDLLRSSAPKQALLRF